MEIILKSILFQIDLIIIFIINMIFGINKSFHYTSNLLLKNLSFYKYVSILSLCANYLLCLNYDSISKWKN